METNSALPRVVNFAIVSAMATAIVYLFAWAGEIGASLHFGYPIGMVEFSSGVVLNLAVDAVVFLMLSLLILQLGLQSLPASQSGFYYILIVHLVALIGLSALTLYYPDYYNLGYLFVPIAIVFGQVLFERRKGSVGNTSSDSRIPNFYDARSEIPESSMAGLLVSRAGWDPLLIVVFILFLFPAAFGLNGYSNAQSKVLSHCLTLSGSDYVILRAANASIIAAQVAELSGGFEPRYLSRSVSSVDSIWECRIENNPRLLPPNND